MHPMRKVCDYMPSKRYLLIFFVIIGSALFAQNRYWSSFEYNLQNKESYGQKNDNKTFSNNQLAELKLNEHYTLFLKNKFYSADFKDLDQNERINDLLNAQILYNNDKLSYSLAYQYRYFDKQNRLPLFPNEQMGNAKKQTKNSIYADYNQDFYDLNFENELSYSSLNLLLRKRQSGVWTYSDYNNDNLHYNGSLSYKLLDKYSVFTEYSRKDDLSENKDHSYDALALGFAYNNKLSYFHNIEGSTQWIWRNSDYIYNKNQILSQLRYKYRFGTNLNAFFSYINRTSYDNNSHEFYLISNYFRTQLKYSFDKDINGESYCQLGLKGSNENKSGAVFAGLNYNIWNNLYGAYDYNYCQKNINLHDFKAQYFFLSQSYLTIGYSIINDNDLSQDTGNLYFNAVIAF